MQLVAESGIDQGRKALQGLRSSRAPLTGIEKALSSLRQELTVTDAARLRIFAAGDPRELDSTVEDQLFLVIREPLTNALRHSQAAKIEVEIEYLSRRLRVAVRDNGIGLDPRKIPYLLVWRSRSDGTVREAVRVAPYGERPSSFPCDWNVWAEIKRPNETRSLIRTIVRPLPRNGGKSQLLVCPNCQIPGRSLFGWEVDYWGRYTTSARTCPWRCRGCAGLRYESEGGGLVHRGRGAIARLFETYGGPLRSPRSEPWLPDVFTSMDDPRLDEIVLQNRPYACTFLMSLKQHLPSYLDGITPGRAIRAEVR